MATTEELIEKYAAREAQLWSRWQLLQDELNHLGEQLTRVRWTLKALEDSR